MEGIPLMKLEFNKGGLITDITFSDYELFERIVSMGIISGIGDNNNKCNGFDHHFLMSLILLQEPTLTFLSPHANQSFSAQSKVFALFLPCFLLVPLVFS